MPPEPSIGVSPTEPSTSPVGRAERIGLTDGRYTLCEELAAGGMGRIWIADDAKLSRRVAIKELLDASTTRRARFERELALTSRLEHPGIVSVHDGGRWPDGKPFYVMKLVRGVSLDEAIARAGELQTRLALVPHAIAAVDAVAYAHAYGIVHRDLKPANVIVGDYGETVVIDWGLAKDLRAPTPELVDGPYRAYDRSGATIGGEVMGTPAYMPPEQALGDAVDERADVYALGALLYHVLSGARPYAGTSVEEVLAGVISEPPTALAAREPRVPADLAAIVDKAMAREPEDRYPTARELAVDLKRFHSGQLVGAHRYTSRQLLWRWMRRHRTAVAVGAIAVGALAVLATASFTRIVREEQRAQEARQAAELERWRAEQAHTKAQGLVDFMLVELRDRLAPIGKLELLEQVAVQAGTYYRDEDAARTPEDQHRRALARHGLGEVLATKGNAAAALAEHRAGLAIHAQLAAADARWQGSLAASSRQVGEALRATGDTAGALAAFQTSLEIDQRLATATPTDAAALQRLAASYGSLANYHFEVKRDVAAALAERQKALATQQQLVALAPDDAARLRGLVGAHAGVADMRMHGGDYAQALVEHRAALGIAERLVAKSPDDAVANALLADRHEEVGGVLHNTGDLPGAMERYTAALAIRQRLLANDPANPQLRGTIARAHMNLGQASDQRDDLAGALVHHRAALAQFEQLLRADASSIRLRSNHAFVARLVGSVLLRQHALAEAIEILEQSRAESEAVAKDEPANASWQRDLAYVYEDLGMALAERGEHAAAAARLREAIAITERIAARDPGNESAHTDVLDAVLRLAEATERTPDPAQARPLFERAVALAEAKRGEMWTERAGELRARLAACCKQRR